MAASKLNKYVWRCSGECTLSEWLSRDTLPVNRVHPKITRFILKKTKKKRRQEKKEEKENNGRGT